MPEKDEELDQAAKSAENVVDIRNSIESCNGCQDCSCESGKEKEDGKR